MEMAKNRLLKNKAKCLLECTEKDEGKILKVNDQGLLELVDLEEKEATETKTDNFIFITSSTTDLEKATDKLKIPMQPITEDNFFNYCLAFIYDVEEYKQSVYKPYHIAKKINNDILCTYFYYRGLEKYLYIMEQQGAYYYKFTNSYVLDVYYTNSVNFAV